MEQLTGTSGLPSSSSGETSDPALADSLVLLRTSYRFQDNSGIGRLASAVKSGSVEQVNRAMAENFADVERVQYTGAKREQWLEGRIRKGFQPMLTASTPEQAFAAMEEFRFLCALRRGPDRVEGINALVTPGSSASRSDFSAKHGMVSRKTDHYSPQSIRNATL